MSDPNTQIEKAPPRDRLRGLMQALKVQIAETLPQHLKPETMIRVVLVEGTRNPNLRLCTAESLAGTIMLASQLGLEPSSPLGRFYLVPRREKIQGTNRKEWRCGFVLGYRGYLELARRAGLRLNAGCVYADELERGLFEWQVEPPRLEHRGGTGVDRTDEALELAYAVAVDERRGRAGHRWQLVIDKAQIGQARRMAQTDRIWSKHLAAMARKTAIRRLLAGGLVPLSADLETAIQAERAVELEAATVLEADELALEEAVKPLELEQAPPADQLRAALDLDNVVEAEDPPDDDPGPAASQDLVERALELEGPLEAKDLQAAVAEADLVAGADLDAQPDEALAQYVKALEARQ